MLILKRRHTSDSSDFVIYPNICCHQRKLKPGRKCKQEVKQKMAGKRTHSPLGWNILETNRTVGGLFGYSSVKAIVSLNVPSSNGVSLGL